MRSRSVSEERASDPAAAHEAALRLLERTRQTRSELARKLRDKGYAAAVVEGVLERLAGVGLVDDVEYARAFLRGRWGRRAAGRRKLEQDLRGRGVPPEAIARARATLESELGDVDETASARRVIEQSARRYQNLEPHERRRRLWALLMRRGFDGETIQAVLRADETR